MEEISAALCLQKLACTDGDILLPSNLHHQVFTTLAWDNIDRLEETLSGVGGGASRRVDGIAVQAKVTESSEVEPLPPVTETKRRSIDVPPPTLPTYNVDQREGPEPSRSVDLEEDDITHTARLKNMI
ncbi:Hypp3998 [Branchiostoma lanceolatum]|uniref:Hypp3998 protein n=1 Tax=Branchiostoma lanceolatum TaxID=7740 RepID=A0A8K0EWA4_BRALA|nr:Hypp3998 [Branchiostoma lanceolatum]